MNELCRYKPRNGGKVEMEICVNEQKTKWYTPEENMPPNGKPVMVNIKFPYCGEMHTYGKFTEKGWEVLARVKEYIVDKWSYFPEGKKI